MSKRKGGIVRCKGKRGAVANARPRPDADEVQGHGLARLCVQGMVAIGGRWGEGELGGNGADGRGGMCHDVRRADDCRGGPRGGKGEGRGVGVGDSGGSQDRGRGGRRGSMSEGRGRG